MITLHRDISVQPDKLNLPHHSPFKKQKANKQKNQKNTPKKTQDQSKPPQKPHTLIPQQKWGAE